MGYGEVLEVMARLHGDARSREAFQADASSFLRSFALTPLEAAGLVALRKEALERIARASGWHRLARLRDYLPWVDPCVRPELGPLVEAFCDQTLPHMLSRDEALAFCNWIEAREGTDPPYLVELARLERLKLCVAWGLEGAPRVVEAAFSYDVLTILEGFSAAGWPAPAQDRRRLRIQKVPGLPAVVVCRCGPGLREIPR